jgi:pantothenate synthetase
MSPKSFFADEYFTSREKKKLCSLIEQLKRLEALIVKGYEEADELIKSAHNALTRNSHQQLMLANERLNKSV